MTEYIVKIQLDTDTIIGNGEGYGKLIDSDVVYDSIGIPFIPSKRIKGCLRESLLEALEMLREDKYQVDQLFGTGKEESTIRFSNLFIQNYHTIKTWLEYLKQSSSLVNQETIIQHYTSEIKQTAIEDGVALDNSLRNSRVLKTGIVFEGKVLIENMENDILRNLKIAALNFRYMGEKRTKGFGRITCTLWEGDKNITTEGLNEK